MKTKGLKNSIGNHPRFYAVLGLSLLFFLWKGVYYAFIGSFVPLAIILIILIVLNWSRAKSAKLYTRALKFWAIVLILWAGFRLLLAIADAFIEPMNESHIHEQIGVYGSLLSLLALFFGLYLFRYSKRIKKAAVTRVP